MTHSFPTRHSSDLLYTSKAPKSPENSPTPLRRGRHCGCEAPVLPAAARCDDMGDGGLSAGCLADDRGCMTTADSEADVSGVDAADSSEAIEVHGHGKDGLAKLALSAVGVVFGDIGTSPLYAFRETFVGHQDRKST